MGLNILSKNVQNFGGFCVIFLGISLFILDYWEFFRDIFRTLTEKCFYKVIHTLFYKKNFMRTSRLKFRVHFFQELRRTRYWSIRTFQMKAYAKKSILRMYSGLGSDKNLRKYGSKLGSSESGRILLYLFLQKRVVFTQQLQLNHDSN